MEVKEKIKNQLKHIRQQCIQQYLEPKLSAIASKQVVQDVIQAFLQAHNSQFLQNVADNIFEVKEINQALKQQLKALKIEHEKQLNKLKTNILQLNLQHRKSDLQILQKRFESQLIKQQKQNQNNTNRIFQLQRCKLLASDKIKSLQSSYRQLQQQLSQNHKKQELMVVQKLKLQAQLLDSKQSRVKLKEYYERMIYSINQQSQIQKNKLLQGIQKQKDMLAIKQTQIKLSIKQIQIDHKHKFTIELQNKQNQIAQYMQKIQKVKEIRSTLESQLQNQKNKLSQSRTKNKQLQEQNKIIKQELQNFIRLSQKKEANIKNLQQQNKYLHLQIISVGCQIGQLEKEKKQIINQIEQFKYINQKNRKVIQQQHIEAIQNMKNQIQLIKKQCHMRIKQLQGQLQQRTVASDFYLDQISKDKQIVQILTSKIQILEHQKEQMGKEIKLHIVSNEVLKNQVEIYLKQLHQIKQECREEINRHRATYQFNWNSANQELLQAKFKQTQQAQQINIIKQDLIVYQQKQRYYSLIAEEIQQLKSQLNLCNPINRNNKQNQSCLSSAAIQKISYFTCKIQHELAQLKTESKNLSKILLKSLSDYNQFYYQTVEFLLFKSRQQYLKCSYCLKTEEQKNPKIQCSRVLLQRTIQRGQQNCKKFGTIKKTLKDIQYKYEVIDKSNTFYSNHIESLVRKQ